MIYFTGDTHSDFARLSTDRFPEQKNMSKNDYVIICGDFGGLWKKSNETDYWLKWLSDKPFTTLFVDGNHENFEMLNEYPTEEWNGGKIHKITDSLFHLMRGQIFNIDDKKIFTFGGAKSHDIRDGILTLLSQISKKNIKSFGIIWRFSELGVCRGGKKKCRAMRNMQRGLKTLKRMIGQLII